MKTRILALVFLLIVPALNAQITPLRNAVLQNRLEANGHPINGAGNITVGTASLGTPGVTEFVTLTINASGDDLFASGANITTSDGYVLRVIEGNYGSGFGTYWQAEGGDGNEYFIDGTEPADAAAALWQLYFNYIGIEGERVANALTLPVGEGAQEDYTTSNPAQIGVVITQGADAVPPSGTGVIVTTTGNVTRIVDGTVQQSGGDVFTQEGTGKLWRLKITGTESAPVLTLQSID